MFLTMYEKKNGQIQGGVTKFPLKFASSAMRARVSPRDGQVYLVGLQGWQTNARTPGGFDRIRYTGAPVAMPNSLNVTKDGILIGFTTKLDPELANDVSSYAIKGKKIVWSHGYGTRESADNLTLTGAELQPDGKTVLLKISDIRPVHMAEIKIDVETTDGKEIITTIYNTIHVVE